MSKAVYGMTAVPVKREGLHAAAAEHGDEGAAGTAHVAGTSGTPGTSGTAEVPVSPAPAEPVTETVTEPVTDSELESELEPEFGSEPEPAFESRPEPEPESRPESATEAEAEPVPAVRPRARTRAEPAASSGPEPDGEVTSAFIPLEPLDVVPQEAARVSPPVPVSAPAPEGTAEQPLPPLDLLARLTNSPPPPETAARSGGRRFKIWVPLFLLLVGVLALVQALRPLPALVLADGDAPASVTLDGRFDAPWPEKGQAAVRVEGAGDVGTFGAQQPVPTASVAKVMTAYVVLKGHPLKKDEAGPSITVDDKAVADGTSENESRVEGLTTGTRFTQQDMLKMLMIPSGNNIARLLARWDTGSDSEAAFVEKMNAEAKALGMTSTTYTDPSGLDAKTVSTAVDQLKLAEAVMRFDAFRAIVQLPSATIPGLPKAIVNNNDNLLLSPLSIKGIKTGSSSPAGGALMWAAYKSVGDKTPLILGTMLDQHVTGADPNGSNSLLLVKDNSRKVIEAVRAALTEARAVKKGQVLGYVDDGFGTRTPVVAAQDAAVVAVPGQRLELTLEVGEKGLPREARAGTEIGVLTVGTGPGAVKVPAALGTDLSAPSFGDKLLRLP
ncbi:serine hydrolase [Streptomyces sp. NPDC006544]|uniref:serine hydrolase n=1 Tax=Streptomyces sp. NPDC006544 TaxID=3154583 RepID=UPI0033ACF2BA